VLHSAHERRFCSAQVSSRHSTCVSALGPRPDQLDPVNYGGKDPSLRPTVVDEQPVKGKKKESGKT
jgi:hypothetical protein